MNGEPPQAARGPEQLRDNTHGWRSAFGAATFTTVFLWYARRAISLERVEERREL